LGEEAVRTATAEAPLATWLGWTLPSFADLFFLIIISILAFSHLRAGLLRDPDTGWHIRNGELIWTTTHLPKTDPFSYTRHGQPWYAWEWLYDIVIAAIHHVSGLNGVVLFTAIVIGCTFALLFRFILRRSGNLVVAGSLTLLSFAAAQVHMLARPHVLSWLFTVMWVENLYCFEDGQRSALLWLPPLMLLWVNVHGGFVLGLGLLSLFTLGSTGKALTSSRDGDRQGIVPLITVLLVCGLTTMLTPYGYGLHVHVYQYLSNHFLMDNIDEFTSPNFHLPVYRYFELFLLLVIAGAMFARRKISPADLLLLLFSIHAALFAVRNIPVAAIIMSMVLGPVLTAALFRELNRGACPRWLHGILESVQRISENMSGLEKQLHGHLLAGVVTIAAALLVLHGGRGLPRWTMATQFDEKVLPVRAAEYIAQRNIHDHLFSTDSWGSYLIYRLYPGFKVYFDDRHDFYGEAFVKDCAEAFQGARQWREPLDKYQVQWVLMPTDSALSSLLREDHDWRVDYDDGLAMLFSRIRDAGGR
jgi:hypothetical protein